MDGGTKQFGVNLHTSQQSVVTREARFKLFGHYIKRILLTVQSRAISRAAGSYRLQEKGKDEGEVRRVNISTARHGRAATETTEQRDTSLSNNTRERERQTDRAEVATETVQHVESSLQQVCTTEE